MLQPLFIGLPFGLHPKGASPANFFFRVLPDTISDRTLWSEIGLARTS